METKNNGMTIRVLMFEADGWWSAQCLEHDIATQAKTLSGLYYEVERTLVAHATLAEQAGEEPFAGIGPAPRKYWELFNNSHFRFGLIEGVRPAFKLESSTSVLHNFQPEFRYAERLSA